MEAREIIEFIGNAEKKTPVKVYVKEKEPVDFAGCQVFGNGDKIVFGDWAVVQPILAENADKIEDFVVENDCRNSAIPLLDMKNIKARIEPGAFIRDKVEIGDNAVIMMGAIINIGAVKHGVIRHKRRIYHLLNDGMPAVGHPYRRACVHLGAAVVILDRDPCE